MPATSRATDYCVNPVTGSDTASGRCADRAWATLGPSQNYPFVSGDRVLLSAARHVHPLTAWYMKPGVSWIGAGREVTTVVYNKAVAVPFVRFATGSAGSGPPGDLRPDRFTATTVFSDMTLLNEGAATIGITVDTTSGESAPTITRVRISGFASGIVLHPSSDERAAASTRAVITNSVIRGASDSGLLFFADVFYARAVSEASTATNVAVETDGVGAKVKTLINDMRDAASANSSPILTNATLSGGGEAALLLVSYYDDGTAARREQRNAGTTGATVRGGIFTGSAGHGLREHSPFTEPAVVERSCFGGNAIGDYFDEGTTTRAATTVGTGNISDVPVFVDRLAGDLHQMANSPTVDRLTAAAAPADDFDGHARPQSGMSDMGADEYVPCTAVADASRTRQAPACTGGASTLDSAGSSVGAACTAGLTYEWFSGATRIGTTPTLDVSPATPTTYTLRVRCADPALSACFATTTVTVQPSTAPPACDAGADQQACARAGQTVVFDLAAVANAVPPATLTSVQWTASEGVLSSPSTATTTLTVTAMGVLQTITATATARDDRNCATPDTVTLVIRPAPTVTVVAVDHECHDAAAPSVTIGLIAQTTGGTGTVTHAWTASEGTVTGDASAILTLPGSAVTRAVNVSVTVTDQAGCQGTGSTTIAVIPSPVARAGADAQACGDVGQNASAPLDATASSGETPRGIRWTATEGVIADPTAAITSLSATVGATARTITVTLEVTDPSGRCVATDQKLVSVEPGPVATAASDASACIAPAPATFPLDASASSGVAPLAFLWTANEGVIAAPASAVTTIQIAPGGAPRAVIATVEVRDARGTCVATDQQVINLTASPVAAAGADETRCLPPGTVSIALDGSASTGVPPLVFEWTASEGTIANPASAITTWSVPFASTAKTVTASLTVRDATGGCAGADDRVIRLSPRANASSGGPYVEVQTPTTTRVPLDAAVTAGAPPLLLTWTTDLGTFEDTGTTTSSLAAPALLVPEQPADQSGLACLSVVSADGCTAGPSCADVSVVLVALNPPLDPGPTLRVRKGPPDDVLLAWQEAPTDATHDAATSYDVLISEAGCGPFSRLLRIPAVPGVNGAGEPILQSPPLLRCYVIRSINAGGASLPAAPDGTLCR